jgi:hypothetical protein
VRRHDLDVFSLVAGVVFLAAAVLYTVGAYVDLHVDGRVVWSLGLVALGVGGLLAAVAHGRREAVTAEEAEPSGAAADR